MKSSLLSLLFAMPAVAQDAPAPAPPPQAEQALGVADEADEELGIDDEEIAAASGGAAQGEAASEQFGIGDDGAADPQDLGLGDGDDVPPPAPSFRPSTLFLLNSDSAFAVDRAHDAAVAGGSPEDVLEAWSGLNLSITHRPKAGRSWRMAARMKLWGGLDHPDEGGAGKTVLLTELRELRYDRRVGQDMVLQLGLQRVDWSVTDGMSPSVMFAPMDLRFGLAGDPDDLQLPVEAAVARYTISYRHDAHVELAFVPRHRPASLRLWGNDWGMTSPNGGGGLPMGDIAWAIDPSVEDDWQGNLMYFAKPELKPSDFSGALRLRGRALGAQLGLWGFYGYDAMPELRMDPDMALLMGLFGGMSSGPLLEQMTPEMLAAMERFNIKIADARASGDSSQLITSVFHRLAQLGAQARRTWGPFVFAAETAWTPKFFGGRTLYSPRMEPVRKLATLHSVFQVEYQAPPDWLVVFSVADLYVPGVGDQALMLIDAGFINENGLERPIAPKDAHLITTNLAIKSRLGRQLDAMVVLSAHPLAGDYMLSPRLTWLLDGEKQELSLSADFFGGPAETMFGMFAHNDRVLVGYRRRY